MDQNKVQDGFDNLNAHLKIVYSENYKKELRKFAIKRLAVGVAVGIVAITVIKIANSVEKD